MVDFVPALEPKALTKHRLGHETGLESACPGYGREATMGAAFAKAIFRAFFAVFFRALPQAFLGRIRSGTNRAMRDAISSAFGRAVREAVD